MFGIEKWRATLRGSPWFHYLLWVIDILLAGLELFLPFPFWVRLLVWLASVVGNHVFTPIIFRKLLQSSLSFHGELVPHHFTPLPLDRDVLNTHTQIGLLSCVPMAVEFVLKLLHKRPLGFVGFQQDWINHHGGALGHNDF